MIVDEAEFDLDRWYGILQDEGVQVWYTAPTAIRMLMRAGKAAAKGRDFSKLRFLASVGEPLNPEGVIWGKEMFGKPFHDNWWQTETGAEAVAAVIFPPQVAVLGIGAPVLRPWIAGDAIAPRLTVTVTLSADHRVSDGRRGARFLAEIDTALQTPEAL